VLQRITGVKTKALRTHENGNECLIPPSGGIPRGSILLGLLGGGNNVRTDPLTTPFRMSTQ
jgi:hypothetical protein